MLRVEAAGTLGAFTYDLSVEVAAGTTLAVAGPSGAGKSTLLRVAAGLLPGRVTLDGVRLDDLPPEQRGAGYVFQDYALFDHLSVWQNVGYALPRSGRREAVAPLLERFGLTPLADARPRTLSGGERQRVALARALAAKPRMLLLDEPLSALDTRTRARATRELSALLRAADVPSVLVTHDFAEAAVLGDEVAIVDAGRLVQRGPAADLAARPESAFVAGFAGMTVVPLGDGGMACLFPWEITLRPAAAEGLPAEVVGLTEVGGRVRVGLLAGQPLAAEVTTAAAAELGLRPGLRVAATWDAATARLVAG